MNTRIRIFGFEIPVWAALAWWGSGALIGLGMSDSMFMRVGMVAIGVAIGAVCEEVWGKK